MSTRFGIRCCVVLLLAFHAGIADETFDKMFSAGKYADAVKYADESLPIGDRNAAIWAKLGVAHEGIEMVEKALACYMVAMRNDAQNYEAHLGAARINNNMGSPENAMEMAKKALVLKVTGEANWEYARACLTLKSPETKAALEKVIETDKTNAVATRELGNIYFNSKDYAKALPLLISSYSAQTDGETAYKLAVTYQKQNNLDSAAFFYKESTRDKRLQKPEITLELARIYFKQEKFSNAADEFGKTNSALLTANDLYQHGISLEKSGKNKESIVVFEAAVTKFGVSNSNDALLAKERVGRSKLEKKEYKEALDIFLAISKADPQSRIVTSNTFLTAEAYDGMGERIKAIPMLEKVIAADKNNVEAYARLADLYAKEKLADKSQEVYSKLLTLQPNNPKVYLALGDYNLKIKKLDEAFKYFQKSFTLEPSAIAAEGMMSAAWEQKKFDLALDAAETALHHDQSLTEPKIILSKIHINNKNYQAAIGILEELVKKEPVNLKFWSQLATCYEQTKNSAKLAETDKTIVSLDSKDVISRQRLAQYHLSQQNYKDAFTTYKELADLKSSDASTFKNLYDISLKLANKDDAADYLKKYVKIKPADAVAQKDLGNILYEKKDAKGAITAYKAALSADPTVKGFYKAYAELVLAQNAQEEIAAKGSKPPINNKVDPFESIIVVLSAAVKAGEADENIFTKLADIYEAKKQYALAIEMYQKALQLNPQNFSNLSALAFCQEKAEKTTDAIITYEQVTAMKQATVEHFKSLGNLYSKANKKDQSIAVFKKLLEKGNDSQIAEIVGEYEFNNKNYKEAYKYLEKVSGQPSKSAAHLNRYATSAYQCNDLKKAEEIFKALVVVNPKDPEPFRILYEIARKENNLVLAADYLQKFTQLKSDDPQMLLALGDLYYDQKNTDGALAAYKSVLKVNPSAKGLYKKYIELINEKGTAEEKIKALTGAIAANEADVHVFTQLADIYKKAGDFSKASQNYEKASQLDPKNITLLVSLAECQAKSGSIDISILTYEQAIALNPQANFEYKALGDLYLKQKKNESAVKNYKKFLEKNSDNTVAIAVGEYALTNKNYPEAVKCFALVQGEAAKSAKFLRSYGKACYEAKNDQAAIEIYRQLATLTPQDAEVVEIQYKLYSRAGAKDNALAALRKYTALKPSDVESQRVLGDLLYEQKDNAGALAAYRAVLKADSTAKGFYKKYAELVISSGAQDEEIASALNGGIAAGEADVAMYEKVAAIYTKQGNHAKAVQMYEKASQLDSKNVSLLTSLAQSQAKNGNTAAAILTYEQAVAMNPQAGSEYKVLGDLYKKEKKADAAIKSYKKYLEKSSDNAIAKEVGEYAFNAKNYPEAIKYLGMITGADATTIGVLKMNAEANFQAKDDFKAYQIYKQLGEKAPGDATVFKKLYEIAGKAGTKDEVLTYLKKYAALKPSDIEAQRVLGDMLHEKNDAAGALAAYRAVLKADPAAKGFYKKYAELVIASNAPDAEITAALSGGIAAGEADVGMYKTLAALYSKQGNNAGAVQMYEKASQLDTKDISLLSLLAESQAKSGSTSAAILTYEQAVAMNPQANSEYKVLGDLYKKEKKTDAAIKSYKKYLEKNSDNVLAKEIGEYAFKANNYAEAIKYLGMITGADASSVPVLKMYGEACFQAKDDFKAYQIYKQLGDKAPGDADVFKKLYQIAGKAGTKDEVMTYLKKYTALKPADIEAQRVLGDMLYEKKDAPGALAAYRAVLKGDPAVKGFYKKYAELVIASGAPDAEIVTALSGSIAAGEADVGMYKKLGALYSKQGNNAGAVQMYEKAAQLDTKDISLLSLLAESQAKSGSTSAAILTYEQAVAMNPQANSEYKVLGDLYKKEKKTDAAIKSYKKYLEKNSDNALAKEIGEHAFKANNYAEAIKYLGMITGADASSVPVLKMYGEACFQAKDDFKAYQIYKQIGEKSPSDADVFEKLYQIAGKAGTKDEVLTYLKKYTVLKPADVEAQRVLGDMLYEKKDSSGALAAYRAVLKGDPQAKGFYKKYFELLIASGAKDEEIVTALNGGIASGEADVGMYVRLAGIYTKQGNHVKAVQMYEKASQLDTKNVDLLSSLAQSQANSGNVNGAILTYEQTVAMNPQASKEYKILGDLYKKQTKLESAMKSYKKYLEKNSDNALAKEVGEYSYNAKNYAETIKYLAMVTGADASSVPLLKMYGEACSNAKDDVKAYQIYKQLVERAPTDADVVQRAYEIAKKAGTKDDVLSYLKKYTALKSGDAEAQVDLGNILYERKETSGAIAAYKAALKANPASKGFFKKYAELVMANGTEDEIVPVLNGAMNAGEADVKMYVRMGTIYRKQGNFAKAVAMYEKASQLDPKNGTLLIDLADALAKSGNLSAAVMTYEQAVAMNPGATLEYKALGDLYMQQKKTDPAIKNYKVYLEKTEDNSVAKLIGESAFNQKNYPEAVKYYAMVTGKDATDSTHLLKFATACFNAKDEFRAFQLYKQLSTLTPKNPEVFEKLYTIASRTGTKDEVLNYLTKLTELKPSDANAQKSLGNMLFERKNEPAALAAYRAALKADPNIKGFYRQYASLVIGSGQEAEKIIALNGAIAAGEADSKMYEALASIYFKQNQIDKAIQNYEKAAQLEPKNPRLLSSLAECQLKKGSVSEAIMTLEQVLTINPQADKEYKMLGDLYLSQKKTEPAIRSYKKYLEKNPSDNSVALVVGTEAFKVKNNQDAVKYLAMVTGPETKKATYLQNYGDAAFAVQDNPRALNAYKELAIINPKDVDVLKKLYEISLKAGASEDALSYLRKYTVLKPIDADAQKSLGDILFDKKDNQGALLAYQAALKSNPAIKGFYKKYIQLVLESGKPLEKMSALNGAIAAGEADANVYATLGSMYIASANYPKAIEMLNKASQLDPKNVSLLSSLADCQIKTGALKEAALTLEQALAMNPAAVKEYKLLGDLYLQQKKTDAAISAYKKYLDKSPTDYAIAKIVGKAAYGAKDYSGAFKYFSMVKDDETPQFLLDYSISAINLKDYRNAIVILEKLRAIKGTFPSKDVAYKSLADAYEKSGDQKKAAEVLNQYVKIPGVKDPDASYKRAEVYESINAVEAVSMYRENIITYPNDHRSFLKLGIYYSRQKDGVLNAVKYLEKVTVIADTISRVWLELGNLYGRVKRDQDMLKAYQKFLEVDPENADAIGKIGEILMGKKMINDAMVFLEMANALKENDPKLMTLLARGYIMTKRRNEGAALLEKVVKISKGNVDDDLRMVLIDVYLESSQFAKAIDELKIVMNTKKDKDIMLKYARALFEISKYPDAISIIEEIKTKDPENIEAQMLMGKIRTAQKKYDDAIETYKEILYIDQNYAPALCERANIYLIQGKYQWAQTFYERALKAEPKNALVHLGLAKVAKQQKDYATYTDHLEKARKLDPQNREILEELKTVKK